MNQPALILPVALQMKTLCSLDDGPVTLLGCLAFFFFFPQQSQVCLSAGHLDSHDLASGLVDHLVDGAVRPAADLSEVPQIFGSEVTVLLRRDLQLPRRLDAVRPQTLSGGVDVGENGGGGGRGGHRKWKEVEKKDSVEPGEEHQILINVYVIHFLSVVFLI